MTVPFELKAASSVDGMAGEFSGYAAGIHNIDAVGDMILPGAFNADLPRFLAEGAVCYQHDWTMPMGSAWMLKRTITAFSSKLRSPIPRVALTA